MTQLIDKRPVGGKKNTVNRQRFLERYMKQIKEAVSQAISKRSITDLNRGEQVILPKRDLSEPIFSKGQGGRTERVLPGNDHYSRGDTIAKPTSSQSGSGAGNGGQEGQAEDDFVFELSREEFLDIYFQELELPDLVRKELSQIETEKTIRAGVVSTGMPTNLNILKSMRQSFARRTAIAAPYKSELILLLERLDHLKKTPDIDSEQIVALEQQVSALRKKIKTIPFLETIDLRYNHRIKVPSPSTQAVMFCLMDVSGSMDEVKKEIAKRFFILLYLFLNRNYKKIELVFIRHHTSAKEVLEEEFFYSRETGGTVVSSALELLANIIHTRYPVNAWNIYVAQASDGDNWNADSPYCFDLLKDKILPYVQYYAYVEIMPRHHQSLWEVYSQLLSLFSHFAMENINTVTDIYPVFRALFKRKTA